MLLVFFFFPPLLLVKKRRWKGKMIFAQQRKQIAVSMRRREHQDKGEAWMCDREKASIFDTCALPVRVWFLAFCHSLFEGKIRVFVHLWEGFHVADLAKHIKIYLAV